MMSECDTLSTADQITIAWLIAGHEGYGIARALFNLGDELQKRGWRTIVIAMQDGELTRVCRVHGYEVITLGIEPPPNLSGSTARRMVKYLRLLNVNRRARKPLIETLRREGVDLLHVMLPTLVRLAGLAARGSGAACVWEMAGCVGRRVPFRLNQRIYQNVCARYGILPLANSAYTASTLGTDRVEARVFHLSADAERFDPDHVEPVRRDDLNIPPEAIVIGMVARVIRDKGQREVLQAILGLLDHDPPVHLLLLGGVKDASYGEGLIEIAEQAGAGERLHLVGAVDDPERYYPIIDVAVNNCLTPEAFGLSVIEAMLMKCPMLVYALGGPAETVIDGETGWHVAEPDAQSLQIGLKRALDDQPRWVEMGLHARRHALAHFTTVNQADRFVAFIDELMKSRIAETPLT
ncbi:MAG: glycosyltransferase family 4 protein [Planctomycetes bacterium]|nr:glycosyltransferase family 4 protein [Planctomycetota bacterium]